MDVHKTIKSLAATLLAALLIVAFALAFAPAAMAEENLVTQEEFPPRTQSLRDGIYNNDNYAKVLMTQAGDVSGDEKRDLLEKARQMSPDLPAVYFKQAFAQLPNIPKSIITIWDGFRAYKRNFWWGEGLKWLLTASLVLSLTIALVLVATFRILHDIPIIAHDVNESKAKLLLVLIALAPSVLGPQFFALGCLMLSSLYVQKRQKFGFYLAAIFIALAPMYVTSINKAIWASSAQMRAIVSVAEGRDNMLATQVLKDDKEYEAHFTYAMALKRRGEIDAALSSFAQLQGANASDKRILTNIGNVYVAAGDHAKGKEFYEAAKGSGSVVPVYNLGQLYRDELNYDVGDQFFAEANGLDRTWVIERGPIEGKHFNRLVADETLKREEVIKYLEAHTRIIEKLSPVDPMAGAGVAILLAIIFIIADKKIKLRGYRCTKCDKVICNSCSEGKQWGNMCFECYKGHVNLENQSPQARVAFMLQANERKQAMIDRVRMLSFLPPGVAQAYSGRVLSALLYMWAFVMSITVLVLNYFFTTGMAGFTHSWLWAIAPLVLICTYTVSVMTVNARLERGWL